MAEKPILFSTPMVRAILNTKPNTWPPEPIDPKKPFKWQTRRVIKPQPDGITCDGIAYKFKELELCRNGKLLKTTHDDKGNPLVDKIKPPFQPGDILWVREMWRIGAWNENTGCIAVDYETDNYHRREWIQVEDPDRFERYWIDSSDDAIKAGIEPDENGKFRWEPGQAPTRWRPAIFMPREAARIFLEVTDVRVERVQEITEEDAIAEGISLSWSGAWHNYAKTGLPRYISDPRESFRTLWNSIYSKKKEKIEASYPWESNPWVWVICFERIARSS